MQIVSNWDNLHEISKPVFLGEKKEEKTKKNIINLSSTEFAQRVIEVKPYMHEGPDGLPF